MLTIALSLFYFLLFCLLIYKHSFFNDFIITKKCLLALFTLKGVAGVALWALYEFYYIPQGQISDMHKFFIDAQHIHSILFTNPIDYLKIIAGLDFNFEHFEPYYEALNHWFKEYNYGEYNDNQLIIRTNALMMLFSFGKIHVHIVLFNIVSFCGLWALYKGLSYFTLHKKLLFLGVFLIPSTLLWGSGMLKEALLFFGLGFFILLFTKLYHKGFKIKIMLASVAALTFLLLIKAYVIVCLLPFISFLLIDKKLSGKFRIANAGFHFFFPIILLIISHVSLPNHDVFTMIKTKQRDFVRVSQSSGSVFSIPTLQKPIDLLWQSPIAFANTALRPFIWQKNKAILLLNSMENLLLALLLFAAFFYRKKLQYINTPLVFVCIGFVVYLFVLIGLTTPVAGAIVRYKIPAHPFWILLCLLLIKDSVLDVIKNKWKFLASILPIFILLSCVKTEKADLVIHNATIITLDDKLPKANAMAISNGKIIAIGSEHEIMNRYLADSTIDLKKMPVYPAFIDVASYSFGNSINQIDLEKELLSIQSTYINNGFAAIQVFGGNEQWQNAIVSLEKKGLLKLNINLVFPFNSANYKRVLNYESDTNSRLIINTFSFTLDSFFVNKTANDLSRNLLELYIAEYKAIFISENDSLLNIALSLAANRLEGLNDLRWRVENIQVFDEKNLPLLKDFTILPSISPQQTIAPMRQLYEQNQCISIGSNFPLFPLNAFTIIANASDSIVNTHSLNRLSAIKALSKYAAIASCFDEKLGSLSVGKNASFVVLSNFMENAEHEKLKEIRFVEVFIDGEK